MSLYPAAEQVPWGPTDPIQGRPTYYVGTNVPSAVVLHRMQGYRSTARQWALSGHYGASWHYTVGFDGSVMQHLAHRHGGYHAGIEPWAPSPTWPLWRGHGENVNRYTIGVECEGASYSDERFPLSAREWPDAQLAALRDLCRWLAAELRIPYERERFPAHAEIDVVNRVNDFDTPERRDSIVYPFLFGEEEDEMTPEERARLEALEAALGGQERIRAWNANGNDLLLGYEMEQRKLADHLAQPASDVADHEHYSGAVIR